MILRTLVKNLNNVIKAKPQSKRPSHSTRIGSTSPKPKSSKPSIHRLPSEWVAISEALKPIEEKKARERQGEQTDKHSGNFPESTKGDTRDKVGKAVGVSGKTPEKAELVVKVTRIWEI